MGMMIDGSLSARHRAALRLLADELGCSDCGAISHLLTTCAAPYLADVDNLGLEALGFDQYGQRQRVSK